MWPRTLLGSSEVEDYYQPKLGMYFFDRNRSVFEHICRFYQSDDDVEFPRRLDEKVLEMELEFFKIGWTDLNQKIKTTDFEYVGRKEKAFGFFNDHRSSTFALWYMILELTMIVLSIGDFLLEDDSIFNNFIAESTAMEGFRESGAIAYIGLAYFTIDFVARVVVSLDWKIFFSDITTWLDIIALIPYYLDIFVADEHLENFEVLMILKIFRVARCFKIIRRSERLRIIVKILGDCKYELFVMLFVWILGALLAGSLEYIAENWLAELIYNATNPEFYSILESTWWAQVTMSSIGYGDISPVYAPGKVMATFVIVGSTILTAIPMTFIVRRFSLEYDKVAMRDQPWKILGSEEIKTGLDYRNKAFQQRLFEEKCGENACYAAVLAYRKKNASKVCKSKSFSMLLHGQELEETRTWGDSDG